MILFCDEDVGTNIPQALQHVGLDAIALYDQGWAGKTDKEWLTEVGRKGWLTFSCNKKMLRVRDERATIISEKVGIVFLTSGSERLPATLRLLLTKWRWFERIDRSVPRPFAFFLYPNGQVHEQTL